MEKIVGLKIPLDSEEEGADSNILLESEELDSIAVNRYYEVQKSNAVFGYAATLFNEMKPQDARTRPEKVAFKYAHSKISKETFIFVNIETNSPTRRMKQIPFMLQFVASLEQSATKEYEGIFTFCQLKSQFRMMLCKEEESKLNLT